MSIKKLTIKKFEGVVVPCCGAKGSQTRLDYMSYFRF